MESSDRSATAEERLDDADFGHIITRGTAIGIPLTFLVALVMSLPGAGWPLAAGIAVAPAIVGGPFIGGFIMLIKRLSELDAHQSNVTLLPAERAFREFPQRHAA